MAPLKSGELERLEREHGWRVADVAELRDGVWATAAKDAVVDFPDDSHALLAEIEAHSLWFQSRNDFIWDALKAAGGPPSLWDVGSGNGTVSRSLQRQGMDVVSVEPSWSGAVAAASSGVAVSVCGTLEALALPDNSVEAIGMFDVVEHLERPEDLLVEVVRVLRPGGVVAVTVPAGQWLWSQADEVAGHHRRYSLKSLDAEMAACDLNPGMRGYCFASAILPLYLARTRPYRRGLRLDEGEVNEVLRDELGPRSLIVERVGGVVMALERRLVRRGLLPFGTSLLGVYRKHHSVRGAL